MGKADVFERMRADHRYVLREISILDRAAERGHEREAGSEWPGDPAIRVLDMLTRQFETHMAAEDEVLFPALAEALPQTRISLEPLAADHAALRGMLRSLKRLLMEPAGRVRDEQIGIDLRDFVDLLRIHIRKEEAVVIGVAERMLQPREVEALAARMVSGRSDRAGSEGAHGKGERS
ncbi:MAG: hemerythrin domain-containing protein [Candidatus Eiseniibacteriota bacterium]